MSSVLLTSDRVCLTVEYACTLPVALASKSPTNGDSSLLSMAAQMPVARLGVTKGRG